MSTTTLQNQLATNLMVPNAQENGDGLKFWPNGDATSRDIITVTEMTASLTNAVSNGHLAITATDPDKVKILAEITGTGAEQTIAHGLGVTPSYVAPMVTENPDTGYGGGSATPFDFVEGVHDATSVKVTMTSGIKFKVLAVAV